MATTLVFEKSEVCADIMTVVDSIKNPRSGNIIVKGVGELIMDDPEALCKVVIRDEEGAESKSISFDSGLKWHVAFEKYDVAVKHQAGNIDNRLN